MSSHLVPRPRVWIVGASFGIGRALAQAWAQDGAQLVLSGRTTRALEDLKITLLGEGHQVIPCDVTDLASVCEAARVAWSQEIDRLIFAPALYQTGSLADFSLQDGVKTMETNYRGLLYFLEAVLPFLKQQKRGQFTVIGSVAGYYGLPNSTTYGASKAAVNSLTQSLKIDLEPYNIDVRLVCPGFVQTRLIEKNTFKMPGMVTAEFAAATIVRGLKKSGFEIHFPKTFTLLLKALAFLPYSLFFKVMRSLVLRKKTNRIKKANPG